MIHPRDCKTARGRATAAICMIKRPLRNELCRAFDDCFEAGDGTDVVKIIVEKSKADGELERMMRLRGLENWLAPDYFDTPREVRP